MQICYWSEGVKHDLLLNLNKSDSYIAFNCFYSCCPYSGWAKVFSSNGTEIFHHGGCSSVHGGIEKVHFDGSSFLTVKLYMRHEWSYVRTEFVILEGEKSLYSGKLFIKHPQVMRFILLSEKSENN